MFIITASTKTSHPKKDRSTSADGTRSTSNTLIPLRPNFRINTKEQEARQQTLHCRSLRQRHVIHHWMRALLCHNETAEHKRH